MVDMGPMKWIEVAIAGFFLFLFAVFTIIIKKNNEYIFISMRSSNLMIITNALIFLSICALVISDIFYNNLEDNLKYFSVFYFIFRLSTFIALIIRYLRLYISCLHPEDNNVQFNLFVPKSYHYEYFYVRTLAIIILLILAITALCFFVVGHWYNQIKDIMISYEILFINKEGDDINEGCYWFWSSFSFIETMVFLTFFFLIERTNLNPNVHISLEIFLVSLINYIYSLSMILAFLNKDFSYEYKDNIIKLIPIIYNILIYFVVIALPFLYGVFNTSVIIYDLPGELCSSLYLFLTKEKCFDAFYNFLHESVHDPDRDKHTLFLNLLINIFKYRLLVSNNESVDLIHNEANNIKNNYLIRIISLNWTDTDKEKNKGLEKDIVQEAINSNNTKPNLFDKVATAIYQILDEKFKVFKEGEKYRDLKNELEMETNIRCKLANFGLIRN